MLDKEPDFHFGPGSTAYPIQLWAHLSPHPQTTSGVVRCPGDTCRPQPVTQVMHQFTTTVEQAAQNLRHSKCPPLYYLLTIPGISILAWTSLGRSSGCTWSHSCGCSQRSSTRAGGPTSPPTAPGLPEHGKLQARPRPQRHRFLHFLLDKASQEAMFPQGMLVLPGEGRSRCAVARSQSAHCLWKASLWQAHRAVTACPASIHSRVAMCLHFPVVQNLIGMSVPSGL